MLPCIAFHFHNGANFFAGVFGIPFIDDIAEGSKLVVALGAVFGEHDLRIHTHLQIITSETRHILDDNTLDKACLNICNHLLKAWAVEGRT